MIAPVSRYRYVTLKTGLSPVSTAPHHERDPEFASICEPILAGYSNCPTQ